MANTFINRISGSIGTSEQTVYTAGTGITTTLIGVSVASRVQTNILVDVRVTKTGGASAYLCTGSLVTPGSNVILVGGDQKVVLTAGDSVLVKSSVDLSADVVLSALEIN